MFANCHELVLKDKSINEIRIIVGIVSVLFHNVWFYSLQQNIYCFKTYYFANEYYSLIKVDVPKRSNAAAT